MAHTSTLDCSQCGQRFMHTGAYLKHLPTHDKRIYTLAEAVRLLARSLRT